MEFTPYPKTPRLKRDVVITEKIDGTNAQVVISKAANVASGSPIVAWQHAQESASGEPMVMLIGSRTRWITPGKTTDNYGFAQWCSENAEELFKLGEGQHFGEWYGQGIQRGYGLDHRRFALFNTARWGAHNPNTPACCEVVPVVRLTPGYGLTDGPDAAVEVLQACGSFAVPGFMNPEGIIVYHAASKQNFKVLLENDEIPKGISAPEHYPIGNK